MKQKTAMMELIEELYNGLYAFEKKYHTRFNKDFDNGFKDAIKICIKEAKKLLEKEKEQIIDAFLEGTSIYTDFEVASIEDLNESKEYYNQTYLKEDKQ